jgi:hypothetical protein
MTMTVDDDDDVECPNKFIRVLVSTHELRVISRDFWEPDIIRVQGSGPSSCKTICIHHLVELVDNMEVLTTVIRLNDFLPS